MNVGMQVRRYSDVVSFLNRAESFLMRGKAENSMMLGLGGQPGDSPRMYGDDCYMSTVEDGGAVVACGFRSPPFGLIITRAEVSALECLAEDVAAKYETLPAVLGPEPVVSAFAALWCKRAGTRSHPIMRMRVFVAHQVQRLSPHPPGIMRPALESDLPVIIPWAISFHREARTGTPLDPAGTIRDEVAHRRVLLWDHDGAVSMATWAGRTSRTVRIGIAYTPPEHRRRGYASGCVAALTERLLSEGVAYCIINTDVTNATTNKIYPAIGYRPVCDVSNIGLQAVRSV